MYRNYQQNRTGNALMKVLLVLVLVALVASMVVVFVKLDKNEKTTTLGTTAWQIGTINDEGEPAANTGFIRTKNFITVDGLKVELQKAATVEYTVFFYGENNKKEKEFISATDALSATLSADAIPDGAKWVKIVIHPTADAEVSALEIAGYAKQLTVTYNK